MKSSVRVSSLALAACAVLAGTAYAGPLYTTNFGSVMPGYVQNDDSEFGLSLGLSVNTAVGVFSSATVRNNGVMYFGSVDMFLAPFATDLDSRGSPASNIHYRVEGSKAIITWANMGVYSQNYSTLYTFQVVLDSATDEVGFFYGGGFPTSRTAAFGVVCAACATTVSQSLAPSGNAMYFDLGTGASISNFSGTVPAPSSALLALAAIGALGATRRACA